MFACMAQEHDMLTPEGKKKPQRGRGMSKKPEQKEKVGLGR